VTHHVSLECHFGSEQRAVRTKFDEAAIGRAQQLDDRIGLAFTPTALDSRRDSRMFLFP
jgi:hypothetical protein